MFKQKTYFIRDKQSYIQHIDHLILSTNSQNFKLITFLGTFFYF